MKAHEWSKKASVRDLRAHGGKSKAAAGAGGGSRKMNLAKLTKTIKSRASAQAAACNSLGSRFWRVRKGFFACLKPTKLHILF